MALHAPPSFRPAAPGSPSDTSPRWPSTGLGAIRGLALTAAAGTYFLIVVGAFVRASGSGLGCPDWPLCHGQLIPPPVFESWIEWSHRTVGAIVSLLIVVLCGVGLTVARGQRGIVWPAVAIPVLLAVQIVLGAVVVRLDLNSLAVLVHLGFAVVIMGLLVWIAVRTSPVPAVIAPRGPGVRRYARLTLAAVVVVFLLILTGAVVRATYASWACAGFPSCNGELLPFGRDRQTDLHLLHRLVAIGVVVFLGYVVARARRDAPEVPVLRRAAHGVATVAGVQVLIGVTAVSTFVPPIAQVLHVAGAAALWGGIVALAGLAYRASVDDRRWTMDHGTRTPTVDGPSPMVLGARSLEAFSTANMVSDRLRAYLSLTKPRVIVLLLITAVTAMMVAAGGLPPLDLVFWTMLGGALSAGGAGAINCSIDRDIDALMGRTTTRAIPRGAVRPEHALWFGIALGVIAFAVLWAFVNLLSAVLSLAALLFYVFVYTRWLKRSTPHNIVIGGAAGAVPPMVGVAAVTGEVNLLALYLFAIIFFWTPPHFWALALLIQREYERAGIPMLPNVRGEEETRRQILLYSFQLVAVTLLLSATRLTGLVYLVAAAALGSLFVYYAVRLLREKNAPAARRLFKYSMLYLALLFAALVVDRQIVL